MEDADITFITLPEELRMVIVAMIQAIHFLRTEETIENVLISCGVAGRERTSNHLRKRSPIQILLADRHHSCIGADEASRLPSHHLFLHPIFARGTRGERSIEREELDEIAEAQHVGIEEDHAILINDVENREFEQRGMQAKRSHRQKSTVRRIVYMCEGDRRMKSSEPLLILWQEGRESRVPENLHGITEPWIVPFDGVEEDCEVLGESIVEHGDDDGMIAVHSFSIREDDPRAKVRFPLCDIRF